MNGAGIVLLINIAIAGLFCMSFALIAFYDRAYRYAGWFAAAFAMGMAYLLIEYLLPISANIRVSTFAGHMTFLLTLVLLNFGIARHYAVTPPLVLMTAISVLSVVAAIVLQDMPRNSLLRNILYQAPYFLMQLVSLCIVLQALRLRHTRRRPADGVFAGLLGLNALQYLSKPFLIVALGGSGATARDYIETTYAMASQSMGTVLMVATALVMLAMLILNIGKDITARLETDLLSGLLNRRGFQEQLDDIVGRAAIKGMPMTFVICDLDHFKRINDNWGHAAGDTVITTFAGILREGAARHHLLGRVGGEEFAILLPGTNLASGRLFAEAARAAFASQPIAGFPPEKVFTASFGVAEMIAGEGSASLVARADSALYEAKRAGRDCVRVSQPVQDVPDGACEPVC